MKVIIFSAIAALVLAGCGNHPTSTPELESVASHCIVNGLGTEMCDDVALAWCEGIAEHGLAGRGTDYVRDTWTISDQRTRVACEYVGWSGS